MSGPLPVLAVLLAPPGRPAEVVVPGTDWRPPPVWPHEQVVLWGRPPSAAGTGLQQAAASAVSRSRSIAQLRRVPPDGFAVRGVQLLDPPALRLGPRARARAVLLRGAVVELARPSDLPRVVDLVASAAGVARLPDQLRVGAGGTLLASVRTTGGPAVLRAAPVASTGDPAGAATALTALSGSNLVPRLLGAAQTHGASWTTESRLTGTRPQRLSATLLAEVAHFAARLPRSGTAPSASADLAVLAAAFPEVAGRLSGLGDHLDAELAELPGIARHGDLWSGNLLTSAGRLSAVLDWDAWRERGVPGTDLLHLLLTEQRLRTRTSLGRVFLDRPWASPATVAASRDYWRALEVDVTDAQRAAVGTAWWAAQAAGDVLRTPALAHDERWSAENVHDVVAALHTGGWVSG